MTSTTTTTHVLDAPLPAADAAALRARYDAAPTLDAFLPTAEKNADLWRATVRLAKVPDDVVARGDLAQERRRERRPR